MKRLLALMLCAVSLGVGAQCSGEELTVSYAITTGSYPSEITWQLNDAAGTNLFVGGAGQTGTWCLAPGEYTFIGTDSYGDGWNGATASFYDVAGNLIAFFDFSYDDCGGWNPGCSEAITFSVSSDIPGCTDSTAENYNMEATADDGSCCFDNFITINLFDSFGDGWTWAGDFGGLILNGDSVEFSTGDQLTITGCYAEGCYSGQIVIPNYASEGSWEVLDNAGNLVNSGAGVGEIFFWAGSDACVIAGCSDANACNYDASSNVNDGSCEYLTCAGCTDPTACNYDGTASIYDGSCLYPTLPTCECDGMGGITNDADGDGVCDEFEVLGCTESEACNFSAEATEYDDSCVFPGSPCDDDDDTTLDDSFDVNCNCTGEPIVEGCTFSFACNYNPTANVEDGSCIFQCPGCIDEAACNYDDGALQDDGSCLYPEDFGWCDCDGNVFDTCGICNGPGEVYECGCADIPAGYCDCDGNVLDSIGVCGGDCSEDVDLDGICDNVDECIGAYDACGICNGPGEVYECGCADIPIGDCDCQGNVVDECGVCGGAGIPQGTCDCDGSVLIDQCGICGGDGTSCVGCAIEYACNYDAEVDIADNTLCEFGTCGGCINNPAACNYNPTVGFDDGSCLFDDECGVCGGSGIPEGDCDCNGNQVDAVGVCGGDCLNDVNGNGLCDDQEVFGCPDPEACNYATDATADDGSCEYPWEENCDCSGTQEDACGVCGGDGSSCVGCTNPLALNYDGEAILDDGSCCFDNPFPASPCHPECTGDSDGDGICDNLEIEGCQDENACNHIYYATDSGYCDYSCYGCTDLGACNYGDGAWIDDGSCYYGGCNDPSACNYDATALCDDYSCVYPSFEGCTDPYACNYDEMLLCDEQGGGLSVCRCLWRLWREWSAGMHRQCGLQLRH